MTADAAKSLARSRMDALECAEQLQASAIDEIVGAWYVTALDTDGEPLLGGIACIAIPRLNLTFEVSASRPPSVNIRDVQAHLTQS